MPSQWHRRDEMKWTEKKRKVFLKETKRNDEDEDEVMLIFSDWKEKRKLNECATTTRSRFEMETDDSLERISIRRSIKSNSFISLSNRLGQWRGERISSPLSTPIREEKKRDFRCKFLWLNAILDSSRRRTTGRVWHLSARAAKLRRRTRPTRNEAEESWNDLERFINWQ